jgi:hypothetical protein
LLGRSNFNRNFEMTKAEIESKVEKFISRHLKSVAELEVLLLLYQTSGKTEWNPEEVSQALRFNPAYAEALLTNLVNQNLVNKSAIDSSFRLESEFAGENSILSDLAMLYQSKKISVIQMIYENKNDKLHDFAQAFKLRK